MMHPQSIQKTFYKVSDFISWQKAKTLVLVPFFQRRAVWKPGAKSYLIDTIVRGLPIPIIFLRDRRPDPDQFEPIREVVDGQQRLRTVLSYISPELLTDYAREKDFFTVKRAHNLDLTGKTFAELEPDLKRAILDYEFDVHVLPPRIDDREIIQIFRRMNSTNYSLTKQELRNAHYYGEFKTAAYQLAAEQLQRWREWKTFTEDNISRMQEVELTSECLIMIIEGKIVGKSAAHIDQAYEKFDEQFVEREEVEYRFRTIMDTLHNKFSKELPEFVFFKKTLIYTFFAFVYELQLGRQKSLIKHIKPKELTENQITTAKLLSDKIRKRSAPQPVLEATDRRTTNPKERKILLNYLIEKASDA
jgi:uncharacterized protein with ParB-like and HNH nuclease domain